MFGIVPTTDAASRTGTTASRAACSPLRRGSGFAGRTGQAPACAPPGYLGVGLDPDEDPCPLTRERTAPGERLARGPEGGELLRRASGRGPWRKAEPLEVELYGTEAAFASRVEEARVREERVGESRPVRGARHGAAEADDGEDGNDRRSPQPPEPATGRR